MTDEIQFGDVKSRGPDVALRPDENHYFLVEPVFDEVAAEDLPIYVDLDVWIEMEKHARENTNVELGGVFLGHQAHDRSGKPFVVVRDSIRAKHYEATRGSFKFTHETWQQIARDREQMPEGTQMVGWYHTHPGWGVFLSGMDDFICENFFANPLDLALVIDPCKNDRGWFQWKNKTTELSSAVYVIAPTSGK
ncbi:MAG: Mov34/MPN/PAD-1 family protein [Pirellulaceae bacterium]